MARDPRFLPAYCELARVHLSTLQAEDHTPARLQAPNAILRRRPSSSPMPVKCTLSGPDTSPGACAITIGRALNSSLPGAPCLTIATVYFETAMTDRRQGRWAEALRNFERAVELDPRNLEYLNITADDRALRCARYGEADRIGRRALALSPHDKWLRIFLASQPLEERADTPALAQGTQCHCARKTRAPLPISEDSMGLRHFRARCGCRRACAGGNPTRGIPGYLGFVSPREWYVGYTARIFDRPETATQRFARTRPSWKSNCANNPIMR